MFQTDGPAIDHFKDVPGFKGLLKAILKHQIQVLVEQLSKHADEETIVLSASLVDGGLSHLGSGAAKDFLEEKEEIKIQFLRHCLTKQHKKENAVGVQRTVASAAVDMTGYQDTMTWTRKEPAHYAHITDHSNNNSNNSDGPHYERLYPPPRTKARKRSHPKQIKPVRTSSPPMVQYSQQEHGIDLSNHVSKKPKLIPPSQGTSSGNHVLACANPRSPQPQTHPIALVKIEPSTNSDHVLSSANSRSPQLQIHPVALVELEPSTYSDISSLDLSLNNQGIDLSTHSKSSSLQSHRRKSMEKESQQRKSTENEKDKPHLPRTHSLSPPSIISLKDSVKKMPIKVEADIEPESKVSVPGAELSGCSSQVEEMNTDHTSSNNDVEQSLEANTLNMTCGDLSDYAGMGYESLQNVDAQSDAQHVDSMYAFQGVSMVDKYFSPGFDFRPPPQKKRVYRKVECDICHKMIYITNIKVHKLRHIRNNSSIS